MLWLAAALVPGVGAAADGPACRAVRLADSGSTQTTATTALFGHLVRELGYQPAITVLSPPASYASLRNRDLDIFLGNRMPAQAADRKPYVDDRSIDVIGANLAGTRYTLAVPDYTWEAGLKDFADIGRFAAPLKRTIYGIEPGSDGNRRVLRIIEANRFGLGGFTLVESSEQGLLSDVERAVRFREPIVFLAWAPHPMNLHVSLRYLTGGDDTFGPNVGGAAVYTVTRAGYAAECPNVGRLLGNFKLTVDGLSELEAPILDQHEAPDAAATTWFAAHPAVVAQWLEGVTTFAGAPAGDLLAAQTSRQPVAAFEAWVIAHKIPVGDSVTLAVEYVKRHFTGFFDGISSAVRTSTGLVQALLEATPAPALIAAIALLALWIRRSWPVAVFVALALLFIANQGYWEATLETTTLVLVAASVSTAAGVPLGILAARHPRLYAVMRPVLDLMQTLPTFVYLTPTLVLFGLGVVPGLISTIIFALPAPIRLTHLGISSVPKALTEAGEAFGATRLQLLVKVELPSAAPTIVAGITQCIMLSLSMVVIAALVGAGGLGVPVVRALNTVQVGTGFEAGIAIVLLAIILERIARPAEAGEEQ